MKKCVGGFGGRGLGGSGGEERRTGGGQGAAGAEKLRREQRTGELRFGAAAAEARPRSGPWVELGRPAVAPPAPAAPAETALVLDLSAGAEPRIARLCCRRLSIARRHPRTLAFLFFTHGSPLATAVQQKLVRNLLSSVANDSAASLLLLLLLLLLVLPLLLQAWANQRVQHSSTACGGTTTQRVLCQNLKSFLARRTLLMSPCPAISAASRLIKWSSQPVQRISGGCWR